MTGKQKEWTPDPVCSKKDCFANRYECCSILLDNDFGERECPFFKTEDKLQEERERSEKRIMQLEMGEQP